MNVLEQLRDARPTAPPSQSTLDAVRAAILGEPPVVATTQGRRPWMQSRVLTSAAAVAMVGGGAAVWAVVANHTDPKTTTTIECGADTYIPAETGNPVLDCYNALSHQESVVPPLVGWVTASGLVDVLPKGERPPIGATPLASGFEVDAGVRFATDSLNDAVGPLQSECLSPAAAGRYAQSQLSLAGLAEWNVQVDPAARASSCALYAAVVDAPTTTVQLRSMPGGPSSDTSGNVTVRLDNLLQSQMVSGSGSACLSVTAAHALAARDADDLGIPRQAVTISNAGSVGSGARCATPFVEPAGNVDVVLWQTPRA